jgi:hypothetical protein
MELANVIGPPRDLCETCPLGNAYADSETKATILLGMSRYRRAVITEDELDIKIGEDTKQLVIDCEEARGAAQICAFYDDPNDKEYKRQ